MLNFISTIIGFVRTATRTMNISLVNLMFLNMFLFSTK